MLKVWTSFILLLVVKCQRKEVELLNKKLPRLDDLGNSQCIQLLKDAKIGRFNVRRVCFGVKGVALQSFF